MMKGLEGKNMITIKDKKIPKRCAECECCINKKQMIMVLMENVYCINIKKVNCLCNYRDADCPLRNLKQIYTDTDGNAEIFIYRK